MSKFMDEIDKIVTRLKGETQKLEKLKQIEMVERGTDRLLKLMETVPFYIFNRALKVLSVAHENEVQILVSKEYGLDSTLLNVRQMLCQGGFDIVEQRTIHNTDTSIKIYEAVYAERSGDTSPVYVMFCEKDNMFRVRL